MSEPKHTPGPWLQAKNDPSFVYALNQEGYNRFALSVQRGTDEDGVSTTHDERAANGQLIAAAPDMLEALEAAIKCRMVPITSASEGGASAHSEQVRVADRIRAAITKAKGKS
tara:strand:- start:18 stop:356 length:339 start_codon:yes stop_codon:yes gene_type:complete